MMMLKSPMAAVTPKDGGVEQFDKAHTDSPVQITGIGEIPEHIAKRGKWYKLGYLCVASGLLTLVLTTPRNIVYNGGESANGSWQAAIAIWFILNWVVYYLLQASDPGYFSIKQPSKIEYHRSFATEVEMDENTVTLELSLEKRRKVPISYNSERIDHDEDITTEQEVEVDSDSDDDEVFEMEVEPDEKYDSVLSSVNSGQVPVRAKYCRNSKKFVATFDHYCGLLGTSIGEKNHFLFWWFLFFNTLGLALGIYIVSTGFRDTKAEISTWANYNAHALAATIILGLILLAVGSLFVFHTFLACAAMTSYEFLRSEKISYLQGTRDFDLPFSQGLLYNLKRFCIVDGLRLLFVREWVPRRWVVPKIERESDDVWENMWENKYWSCC